MYRERAHETLEDQLFGGIGNNDQLTTPNVNGQL